MDYLLATSQGLARQLDGCMAHDAEYNHGLSDHLPMLLHSMHALGATESRLQEYASSYVTRLEPRRVIPVDTDDWLALRGQLDAYHALSAMFAQRIAVAGRDCVLRDALPHLMPGVGAGAFHGLIRCGHALAARHDGELANGLAYWAAAWLPLMPSADADEALRPLPPPSLDLASWARCAHDLRTALDTGQPRITLRMKAWSAAPQFPVLAFALRTNDDTLRDIARFAATVYAQTGNFTVMHMVTSAHALLALVPWLDDVTLATRWFGVTLLAALRAARLTQQQIDAGLATMNDAAAINALPVLPWHDLATAAIASDDDHAAKIVYSSRALFEMSGDAVFHAAATQGMLTQTRPH